MNIGTLLLIYLISSISCYKPYNLDEFMKDLEARNPSQPEFIQATRDFHFKYYRHSKFEK